jgi:hypothetical protein
MFSWRKVKYRDLLEIGDFSYQEWRAQPKCRINVQAGPIATDFGCAVFPNSRKDQEQNTHKLAVTVDDVSIPWQFSGQRSMAHIGENILPKTARADDTTRAPWSISDGQQIYGRRDVGLSYESDFDAGQRLPLNYQINRVLDGSVSYARSL